jgi:hypothetical protein
MYKLLIALAAAAAVSAPAAAQDDPASPLPSARDIEAMAPVMDRMAGALMQLDVGPLMDAADPYGRHPGYGRSGRTLGALGRHNDPWFDQRVRGAIYGGTAQAGAMMSAFSAMLPALQRSLAEVQRGIGDAVDEYHRRGDAPYPDPYDDGPWYDPED